MKNKSLIRLLTISLVLIISVSGCLDYTITTQVNPDGSLDRTFTVRGDSSVIFDGSVKVPVDSTWEITTKWEDVAKKDSSVERKYVYTARKHFANVTALNQEIYTDSSFTKRTNIKAEFKKRFRWFYTFITYRETYKMYFPFNEIPVNNYMTETELGVLMDTEEKNFVFDPVKNDFFHADEQMKVPELTKEDSVKMEKRENEISAKFDKWQAENILKEYFNILKDAVKKDTSSRMILDSLKWDNDSLLNVIYRTNLNIQSSEKITNVLYQFLHNFLITQLYDQHKKSFLEFDRKLELTKLFNDDYTGDDYTNVVVMPGLLINTNANTVEGNKVTWNFGALKYYANNYEMVAESRIVNRWAIVLSGVIALVLLVLLIMGIFVKKH
jgi:hypothetical protein